jgi:hypothetical protein
MRASISRPNDQRRRLNRVRWSAICALAATLIGAATTPASAQQTVPVSVDRVRTALQKPSPKLTFEYRQPDFSIHIQERRPLDDLFDIPLWDTPPVVRQTPSMLAHIEGTPGNTPPLITTSIDPGGLAQSAKKRLQDRTARSQTERAITKYCSAQPDAGSSIPLCWAYAIP